MTHKRPLYAFAGQLPTGSQSRTASMTMRNLLSRVSGGADPSRLSIAQWAALNANAPDDLDEVVEIDCADE